MWWMWLALTNVASAHGAAPAVLDVLAWSDLDDGCAATPDGETPAVVRTNIGLAAFGAELEPFSYVCPSRWSGSEGAPSAASGDGQAIVVARDGAVASSADGGCTFRVADTDPGDSVVGVTRSAGGFLVAVRRFDGQPSGLLKVVDGIVSDEARWPDNAPDGVVTDGDAVWVAGATPAPWAARWDGASLSDPVTLPDAGDLDRLTPRRVAGTLWLVAGTGASRSLWRVEAGIATSVLGPAEQLLGPVKVGEAWWASLDGEAWTSSDGAAWTATGRTVGWTCLGSLDDRPFACMFSGLDLLAPGDGQPAQTRVFSLSQLDGPELGRCDAVGDACEVDWYHFGGESGWVDTQGGACPTDARQAADDTDAPPGDGTGSCACGPESRGPGSAALVAAALVALRRRRRISVR